MGDIAQVGAGGQKDRRRKLGKKMVRQVEVQIEAGKVPAFLLFDLLDVKLREDHATLRMVRMRQGIETRGPGAPGLDLGRTHRRELGPRHSLGELDPHSFLGRFAAGHGHALGRALGEVITLLEQILLPLHDLLLRCLHA